MARTAVELTSQELELIEGIVNADMQDGDLLTVIAGEFSALSPGTNGYVLTSNGPGLPPSWKVGGGGGGGGTVDTITGGTGIDVDSTDPANPEVSLDSATISSLGLADSALQSGDNISELTNDAGFTTNTGTVTSVDLSVPTGLQVSGNPVTTSGTLAIALASGYVIPTQSTLDGKVDENAAITGATKTKITYDAKGLVTAGDDATTADIADSTDRRYVTDAERQMLAELNNLTLDTGNILIGDDGSIVELDNNGNSGQVLTSNGAGFPPTWEDAGGGSGTLQDTLDNGNTAEDSQIVLIDSVDPDSITLDAFGLTVNDGSVNQSYISATGLHLRQSSDEAVIVSTAIDANRTHTLQNKSGVVAHLDQIPLTNMIMNGGFSKLWSGTSITDAPNDSIIADMWKAFSDLDGGSIAGGVLHQFLFPDSTPVRSKHIMRIAPQGAGSGLGDDSFQLIRTGVFQVPRIYASGGTFNLSFTARANEEITLLVWVVKDYGTGGSPATAEIVDPVRITIPSDNVLRRYNHTFTLSAGGTLGTNKNNHITVNISWQYGADFANSIDGDSTAQGIPGAYTMDLADIMLVHGSEPADFEYFGGSIEADMDACSAYLQKSFRQDSAPSQNTTYPNTVRTFAVPVTNSLAQTAEIQFSREMMITPTITYFKSNIGSSDGVWVWYNGTSWVNADSMENRIQTTKRFSCALNDSSAFTLGEAILVEGGWTAVGLFF